MFSILEMWRSVWLYLWRMCCIDDMLCCCYAIL